MIVQQHASNANSAIMSMRTGLHVPNIHAMILTVKLAPQVQLIHAIVASPPIIQLRAMSVSHAPPQCRTAMSVKMQVDL